MQPKLLKTELGEFSTAIFTGKNESGYDPMGDRVLVLPDQGSEKTSGGTFLDQETLERITAAAETGILVACGDEAFVWNSDRRRKWEGRKPEIGQRVYFERYAGALIRGDDGKTYRCMDDKAVACIRSQE